MLLQGLPQIDFYRGHGNPSWHSSVKLAEGIGQLADDSPGVRGMCKCDDRPISPAETGTIIRRGPVPERDDCWHLTLSYILLRMPGDKAIFFPDVCQEAGTKQKGKNLERQQLGFHWLRRARIINSHLKFVLINLQQCESKHHQEQNHIPCHFWCFSHFIHNLSEA